ncbi:hypothetical protein [Streptomyces sp. NPDC018693]|uniref:hypothetical protein n=1 Tax=unclassified Streptomyces TaxID=2593676 RepID=UPI0037BD082D
MLGSVTDALGTAEDVLFVVLGLGCVWLGARAVLRPRRSPGPMIQGPVWAVRAWGLGYVLLGISLTGQSVALMTGEQLDWSAHVIRWAAGPLVVGSLVAAYLSRWRERRRGRALDAVGQA